MNIFRPDTPLVPYPVGMVKRLQPFQLTLFESLPWLSAAYGIASTGGSQDGKPAQLPEVFTGETYITLTPNNQIAAHSFFKQEGPITCANYIPGVRNTFRGQMSLIVIADLEQVKQIMSYDYRHRFTEELKAQVLAVFALFPPAKLTRVAESPRDVFEGYTYAQTELQTFRHPFAGFKFYFEVSYLEDCPPLLPEGMGTPTPDPINNFAPQYIVSNYTRLPELIALLSEPGTVRNPNEVPEVVEVILPGSEYIVPTYDFKPRIRIVFQADSAETLEVEIDESCVGVYTSLDIDNGAGVLKRNGQVVAPTMQAPLVLQEGDKLIATKGSGAPVFLLNP